jgi:hypothetical protein
MKKKKRGRSSAGKKLSWQQGSSKDRKLSDPGKTDRSSRVDSS